MIVGNPTVEGITKNIETGATDVLRNDEFRRRHAKVLDNEIDYLVFILHTTQRSRNKRMDILERLIVHIAVSHVPRSVSLVLLTRSAEKETWDSE